MKKDRYTIRELKGVRVDQVGKKDHRIGRVHSFVFHPRDLRVVGFTVKRPDVALMFHRSDIFVALDSFDVAAGVVCIDEERASTGKAACKRLGVDWDSCIVWQGMALVAEDGSILGRVGDVTFDTTDGSVVSLVVDRGASAQALLGVTEVPRELIKGFRTGVGDNLEICDEEDFIRGGIVVSSEVLSLAPAGGLAERAGEASAVAEAKAAQVLEKARPVAHHAAEKADEAVNKGAYALGRQLSKTRGMFSSFKEEYRRARDGEDGESK